LYNPLQAVGFVKSAILAIAVGSLTATAFAQPPPVVEVASVRLHVAAPGDTGGPRITGNRLTFVGSTLKQLIFYAYDLKVYQYSGGPDRAEGPMDGNSYDVVAQAEGEALTQPRARQLLQLVLADRFQLKIHREIKEMPVYALVVGKGGPKFKESGSDSKGVTVGNVTLTAITSTVSKQHMDFLVRLLSSSADRPVLDQTGLTGLYDFKLEYARDPAAASSDTTLPSIFTAIQEQLGLKLEPRTAPIEIRIVDHAERPTAN
jgi:uncharacterized protein (TIGR03435 family)